MHGGICEFTNLNEMYRSSYARQSERRQARREALGLPLSAGKYRVLKSSEVRIIDFGLALFISSKGNRPHQYTIQNYAYRAPEVCLGTEIRFRSPVLNF